MPKRSKPKSQEDQKASNVADATPRTQGVGGRPQISNFREAREYLANRTNVEAMRPERVDQSRVFNLDRMRALMSALNDPHKNFPCIHVAGSKGKGSVCEMVASVLKAAGYGVGLYTSPHLVSIRERIRINNELVSEGTFTLLVKRVAAAADTLVESLGAPTMFEILTAMAFVYFADQAVDFAVIETGMGGLLDATNIIEPEVTVITAIQSEHVQILGPGIRDIARHKAGIIKPRVPCYTIEQPAEVMQVFESAAANAQAPLHVLGRGSLEFSSRMEGVGARAVMSKICLTGVTGQFEHVSVPYMGEHQAANCALALCAVDQLRQRGHALPDGAVAKGLAETPLNGRVQRISTNPPIFIDGAHNPESVSAAIRSVASHMQSENLVVIFGCAADKDLRGMLGALSQCADKVFFTKFGGERSVEPSELMRTFLKDIRAGAPANTAPSVKDAIASARAIVGRGDAILVTGSFHLAGEAIRFLRSEQVIREVKSSQRVAHR